MAADLAKSLTGSVAFTRRTRGMVTRGRFTGTTLGTGETRPRYSKSLEPGRKDGAGGLKQPGSTPSPAMPAVGCHSQSLSRAGAEPGHSLAIGPHRTGLGWTALHPTSPPTARAVLQGRHCPIENSFG